MKAKNVMLLVLSFIIGSHVWRQNRTYVKAVINNTTSHTIGKMAEHISFFNAANFK